MIRLGLFDTIDICLMFHALDLGPEVALLWPRSNAFIAKQARFIGKSSHAGSAPELGVNALHAATLAIMNIDAQRETFRDTDHVRVHYVITKGGGIVNVVPAETCMEITVRACNLSALKDAERKVDRSLQAGALALGAQVDIENLPGYLPILEERTRKELCKDNLKELGIGQEVRDTGDFAGSFDSPTKREERKQHDGSIFPSECRESKVRYPAPRGRYTLKLASCLRVEAERG